MALPGAFSPAGLIGRAYGSFDRYSPLNSTASASATFTASEIRTSELSIQVSASFTAEQGSATFESSELSTMSTALVTFEVGVDLSVSLSASFTAITTRPGLPGSFLPHGLIGKRYGFFEGREASQSADLTVSETSVATFIPDAITDVELSIDTSASFTADAVKLSEFQDGWWDVNWWNASWWNNRWWVPQGAQAASFDISLTAVFSYAPEIPVLISVTPGPSNNVLVWTDVGADFYNIYYDFSPGVTKATGIKIQGVTTPFDHQSLVGGTTYYYIVTTVLGGVESAISNELSGTPTGESELSVTTQLTFLGSGGQTNPYDLSITTSAVASFVGDAIADAELSSTASSVFTGRGAETGFSQGELSVSSVVTGDPLFEGAGLADSEISIITSATFTADAVIVGNLTDLSITNTATFTGVGASFFSGDLSVDVAASATFVTAQASIESSALSIDSTIVATFETAAFGAVTEAEISITLSAVAIFVPSTTSTSVWDSQAISLFSPVGVTIAPSVGTLMAKPKNKKNFIYFQTFSGADSYNLYFKSDNPGVTTSTGVKIENIGTNSPYHHNGLTNGVTYYYVYTAVYGGIETSISSEVSATPRPRPMAPIDRIDEALSSTAVKKPCVAATTANITLSGTQTIDGVSLTSGDRVLVKNQTDGTENGIYAVDTGDWNREPDWDGDSDVAHGTQVLVHSGTTNKGIWYLTTSDPITVEETSISFTKIVTI